MKSVSAITKQITNFERSNLLKKYESHPISEIFPAMSRNDYRQLVADIKSNGLLHPITLYQGKILDGRNRYNACLETGTPITVKEWEGTYQEALNFVWCENFSRRHLSSDQRAACMVARQEIVQQIQKETTQEKSHRISEHRSGVTEEKIPPSEKEARSTRSKLAKTAGTNSHYISDAQKIHREDPELFQKIHSGEKRLHQAIKEINEAERLRKNAERARLYKPEEAIHVVHGDFYKICQTYEDNYFDAIITDPPYPGDYLPLWDQLGEVAARVLRPGRFLVAYSGQMYLDKVMSLLSKHLIYYWTFSLFHSQQTGRVHPRAVIAEWKPILIFQKPLINRDGEEKLMPFKRTLPDVIRDYTRDKSHHEWGQGIAGFEFFIENLTRPNDLILEPFAGGGTTLVAAKRMKRRCIGIEIDEKHVNTIKARLADEDDNELAMANPEEKNPQHTRELVETEAERADCAGNDLETIITRLKSLDQDEPLTPEKLRLLAKVFDTSKTILQKNYGALKALSSTDEAIKGASREILAARSGNILIDITDRIRKRRGMEGIYDTLYREVAEAKEAS